MSQRECHKVDLAGLVDSLMNHWCRRGALRPLQVLLRAYPGPLWHAYHKMELLEALQDVNASFRDDLKECERRSVDCLVDLLKGRLPSHAIGAVDRQPFTAASV